MSKHLFLGPPPNESQTPDRRNVTFTLRKQSVIKQESAVAAPSPTS